MGIRGVLKRLRQQELVNTILLGGEMENVSPSRRTILVDGWNVMFKNVFPVRDHLFCDVLSIRSSTRRWIDAFVQHGFHVVVFFDGDFRKQNWDERVERAKEKGQRMKEYATALETFNKNVFPDKWIQKLNGHWEFVDALRECDHTDVHFAYNKDAEYVMAQYAMAHPNEVFGLITQDSDVIEFDLDPEILWILSAFVDKRSGDARLKQIRLGTAQKSLRKQETISVNELKCDDEVDQIANELGCLDISPKLSVSADWEKNVNTRSETGAYKLSLINNNAITIGHLMDFNIERPEEVLRPVRQHLYHVLGLDVVQEYILVQLRKICASDWDFCSRYGIEMENGACVVQNRYGEIDDVPSECIEEIRSAVESCPSCGIPDMMKLACDVFRMYSPFDATDTDRFANVLGQLHVVVAHPGEKYASVVRAWCESAWPRPKAITAVKLFRQIVEFLFLIKGKTSLPWVWLWMNGPLFHFGLANPREFECLVQEEVPRKGGKSKYSRQDQRRREQVHQEKEESSRWFRDNWNQSIKRH